MKFRLPLSAEWIFTLALIFIDAFLLNAIFLSIFNFWLAGVQSRDLYLESYFQVRWLLFVLYLILGGVFDLFHIRAFRAASDIFSHAIAALLSTFLAFNLLVFLWRPLAALSYTFPRPIILLSTGISIFCTFIVRAVLSSLFVPQAIILRVIIIGDENEGKRILKHFHSRGGMRFRLVGVFPAERIDELASEVIFRHAQEIIVTNPKIPLDGFWASIFYYRKVEPHEFKVRIVYDPSTSIANIGLNSLEDFPLITVCSQPLTFFQRLLKRGFDVLFSIFAILITSPAMILAALLVRLDSPGPIFYKQKRVGRFGREFDLIKFRSMRVGAETGKGPQIATADDPRVTRIGAFLRRFGIDEFPQFFLVLMGEMSVVGPRPERPYFVMKHLEFQGRRLSVRPGVSGLAAVNSRYYLRLTDKVGYDYFYLDHLGIILDVKIIFQTIWVLLFKSDQALEDVHHPLDNTPANQENISQPIPENEKKTTVDAELGNITAKESSIQDDKLSEENKHSHK